MNSKKAQHSAYIFLLIFISVISIFITISVLQGNKGIPTGLVIDEEIELKLAQEQELKDAQRITCDYTGWFKRFTCNLGIYDWFYKESTTTTVYTVDEQGNVVDASIIDDPQTVSGQAYLAVDDAVVPVGRGQR
jgi:hypothetical protein